MRRIAAGVAAAALAVVIAGNVPGATPKAASMRAFRAATVAHPQGVVAAGGGGVWFTNEGGSTLGRITAAGAFAGITDPAVHLASAITRVSDGTVWFVDGPGVVGHIDAAGKVETFGGPAVESPVGIVQGADGALWFTSGGKWIGRFTPADGVQEVVDAARMRGTYGIARGPDGAIWFTNYLGASIGRIGPDGSVTTYTDPRIRYPTGITAGKDSALWFADDSGAVGRITTAGAVTVYRTGGHPSAVTAGSDGAIWATDRGGAILRVSRGGAVTRYRGPLVGFPVGIASTSDGAIWFANYTGNAIVRLRPGRPAATKLHARPRVTFISDSVGAAIGFDTGAKATLAAGVDLYLEPGQARTLGTPPEPGGIAPPTVIDLVPRLGAALGPTVVVEIGVNDVSSAYRANMETALAEMKAAGVRRVLWLTLHETPNHSGNAVMNAAIAAEAASHPELTVVDWNAYASSHPEWFQPDGTHLQGDGPRALARLVHAALVRLAIAQ